MDYAEIAEEALALIEEAGREVVLRRVTKGAYDPDNDARSADLIEETTIIAVFTKYRSHEIDGEIIQRNDKRVLIAAAGLEKAPDASCSIVDGSVTYKIIDVETVQPGDAPLLYKVQARK